MRDYMKALHYRFEATTERATLLENKIKKKYNFDVIFSFPIFQNAFLNESLSPFANL